MYEDVVRRLRKIIKAHKEIYGGSTEESVAIEQAADAIEDLISALTASNEVIVKSKPRWIPVTERLPEKNEMVIAYTPVDGYMFVGFHFSYKWGSNTVSKWRIVTAMRSTKDITKKVTHWMPLPEPPKEEKT